MILSKKIQLFLIPKLLFEKQLKGKMNMELRYLKKQVNHGKLMLQKRH